jgi:hypothetical protein
MFYHLKHIFCRTSFHNFIASTSYILPTTDPHYYVRMLVEPDIHDRNTRDETLLHRSKHSQTCPIFSISQAEYCHHQTNMVLYTTRSRAHRNSYKGCDLNSSYSILLELVKVAVYRFRRCIPCKNSCNEGRMHQAQCPHF